jgi:hypothetical protein
VDDAADLFESLCNRTNSLGLLPEQIDPSTGDFRGNYPQALSHIGVICTATMLMQTIEAKQRGAKIDPEPVAELNCKKSLLHDSGMFTGWPESSERVRYRYWT